jgi:pre-rRNA-processing protein TSR4
LEIDSKIEDSLDWGTLLVYTCKNHCDRANGKYAQEYVFNQAFSSAGLGDGVRKELAARELLLEE